MSPWWGWVNRCLVLFMMGFCMGVVVGVWRWGFVGYGCLYVAWVWVLGGGGRWDHSVRRLSGRGEREGRHGRRRSFVRGLKGCWSGRGAKEFWKRRVREGSGPFAMVDSGFDEALGSRL